MNLDVDALATRADSSLAAADAALAAAFPGAPLRRQPVHTIYVPVDRFHRDYVVEAGREALALMDAHVPDAAALQALLGEVRAEDGSLIMTSELAEQVHPLVRAKLRHEPIEDLRIDFEDGFTQRGIALEARDADESHQLARALDEVAHAAMPPFWGLRFKSFDPTSRERGVRTFAGFVAGAAERGLLPEHFHPTLPKVTSVDQVRAMVELCESLETTLGLAAGTLRFEIQVETPQSIVGPDGSTLVARLLHGAEGRCLGLHYGTYDYSAYCGIPAEYQSMEHPAADYAKAVMQVAAAGTGAFLSDGSTNILPVGSDDDVRAGWRLHARLVDRSLRRGYDQGWDLHPAQLVTRYAATYAFYRRGLPCAMERLAVYRAVARGENPASRYLDEPATARALAAFTLRASTCGALPDDELLAAAGLTPSGLAQLARTGQADTTSNPSNPSAQEPA